MELNLMRQPGHVNTDVILWIHIITGIDAFNNNFFAIEYFYITYSKYQFD